MYSNPYVYLELTGHLKAPKIWFDPLAIVLTPVPLCTTVSTEFSILTANYNRMTHLGVEYPEVECEDGSMVSPLSVSFPSGNGTYLSQCTHSSGIILFNSVFSTPVKKSVGCPSFLPKWPPPPSHFIYLNSPMP
jgi:hypothetical protein